MQATVIDVFDLDEYERTPEEWLALEQGYCDVLCSKAARLRREADELDSEAHAYAYVLDDEVRAYYTQEEAAAKAAEARQLADEIVGQRENVERARREVVLATRGPSLTQTLIRRAVRINGTRSRERRTSRRSRTSRGSPSRSADDDPDPAVAHAGAAA